MSVCLYEIHVTLILKTATDNRLQKVSGFDKDISRIVQHDSQEKR